MKPPPPHLTPPHPTHPPSISGKTERQLHASSNDATNRPSVLNQNQTQYNCSKSVYTFDTNVTATSKRIGNQ